MQHVQERDWICSVVSSFGLSIQSTSKDAIRRYGGSTAPSMPWPPEHEDGTLSLLNGNSKSIKYDDLNGNIRGSTSSLSLCIYIPGTQMTLVLNGKGLLFEGSNPEIEDQQFYNEQMKDSGEEKIIWSATKTKYLPLMMVDMFAVTRWFICI